MLRRRQEQFLINKKYKDEKLILISYKRYTAGRNAVNDIFYPNKYPQFQLVRSQFCLIQFQSLFMIDWLGQW